MQAISLSSLGFSYQTYTTRSAPVFSDVTLSVKKGARVVLVGANGAGKSTLLRLIGGRRKPSTGTALVFGEDAFEHTALALRVNLVTTDWDDDLSLPVTQLIGTAVATAGVDAPRVAQLLGALGIAELMNAELHQLSDGQRRRVQLFCKLLPPRELILLDEATNSLDVLSRAALLAFLRQESEARGCTVVFCTHIFDGLDGWASQVAHIDGGHLRHDVSTDHLPAGQSLYQVVTTWLMQHKEEQRHAALVSKLPSDEELARAIVDANFPRSTQQVTLMSGQPEFVAAAKFEGPKPGYKFRDGPSGLGYYVDPAASAQAKALDAANEAVRRVMEADRAGSDERPVLPKRNRPASPGAGEEASAASSDGGGKGPKIPLPGGWGDRMATIADGAFGSHTWTSCAPKGVSESGVGLSAVANDPMQQEETVVPASPHAERIQSDSDGMSHVSEIAARSGSSEDASASVRAPPPSRVASASDTTSASVPKAASLPEAAARIAPVLQTALNTLHTHIDACNAAVGAGDVKASADAANMIRSLWTQAEKALQMFETAMGSQHSEVRLSPRPPSMSSSASGGGSSQPSESGLPLGWGSRQAALSEEDLVRKGIILPPTPIGS